MTLIFAQFFIHLFACAMIWLSCKDRSWKEPGLNFLLMSCILVGIRRLGFLMVGPGLSDVRQGIESVVPLVNTLLLFMSGFMFYLFPWKPLENEDVDKRMPGPV